MSDKSVNTGDSENRLVKTADKQKLSIIVLAVMILLQVVFVTYYFVFEKENYYADEPYSYGHANSFFDPYLNTVNPEKDSKCEQWINDYNYKKYITVQRGQQFRYDSVWYNLKNDMHPPFYFAVLHTVCSFFPDTFSRYYAYVINVFAMILSQIFLYRAASRICKSEFLGIVVCGFWGFSSAFVNLNIFLRHYSLLTMFSTMFLYYNIRIYFSEGSLRGNLIKLGIITFLGELTHHYFVVLAFITAAFFCIFYLCCKKIKTLIPYACTMLGSTLLTIAAFPAELSHISSSELDNHQQNRMPLPNGIKACIAIISETLTGHKMSPYLFSDYCYAVVVIVAILAVCVPVAVLVRKEEWFKKAVDRVCAGISYFFTHFDFLYLFILIAVSFTITVIALVVNISYMLYFTDRYLFMIMPWIIVLIVLTFKYLIFVIKPIVKYTNIIVAVICCVAVIFSNLDGEKRYLFKNLAMGDTSLEATCTPNSSHVMVLDQNWCIVCYADKLINCGSSFITTCLTYSDHMDEIAKMDMSKDCYVVIQTKMIKKFDVFKDTDENETVIDGMNVKFTKGSFKHVPTEQDIINDFEEKIFPGYKLMFCCSEYIMGGYAHTFRVVPESEYVNVPIMDYEILVQQYIDEMEQS